MRCGHAVASPPRPAPEPGSCPAPPAGVRSGHCSVRRGGTRRVGAAAPWYIAPPPVDDLRMAQRPSGPARDTHDADEALAARLCGHDAAALTLLYDRYAAAVYALASHTLGPTDAEEVVQDVFLSLWNRAGQFSPHRGSFGAWFMALARHRVLDELRRRGARQRLRAAVAVEHLLAAGAGAGAG